MNAENTYLRSLNAASALTHQLRAALLPLAERTSAQLHELHKDTTAERAFLAAKSVNEVYVTLMRLGVELDRQHG